MVNREPFASIENRQTKILIKEKKNNYKNIYI